MGKIWFSIGLFQLGMAAGYGLHFLSVIVPWWGIKTIILGWLLLVVLIACLWCFDEVFINWTKSIASASEYYLIISIATFSIIFGAITWVLA